MTKLRPAVRHLHLDRLDDRLAPSTVTVSAEPPAYVPGRVLLTAAADPTAAVAATGLAAGVDPLGAGVYRVSLNTGVAVETAVSVLSGSPGVRTAEPDYVITAARVANDPSFGSLYGMTKIAAPQAWDVTTGGTGVVVAVIDTGVDYTHPDLTANVWRNTREVAGNGIDDDGNGYRDDVNGWDFANNDNDPMDDNGHGTHVAGTIGAVGNNGVGVVGVNWTARIMPLKFLSASGSGSLSNAVLALNYAVANGARVSNNSYGGGGFFAAMDTAVANARAAGHIFVAAAGNENNNNDVNPSYPAGYNYNNVISVAATDSADRRASFSNYGATSVDIAAPGVNILSTWPNNQYATLSGTSMATPHVTGAAALVWTANPTLTYTQVIDRLYNTADPLSGLSGLVAGGRRLNVGRAVGTPPPPTDNTPPAVASLTFDGTTSVTKATITFSEAVAASSFTAADIAFTGPSGAAIPVNGVTGSGTTYTLSFATQSAVGTYTMVVGPAITDLAGNPMAAAFTGTRAIVAPPTVTTFTSSTALAIRDNAAVTAAMNVTQALTISDLNVRVNLTHTYDSDLALTLVAPDGTRTLLANRRGGAGDNFTNTTFDDEATASIAAGAAPFAGSFRPETALSALDGKNATGTWRLEVRDAAAQDVGTLLSWSLVVTSGGAGARSLGFRTAAPEPMPVAVDFGRVGPAFAELPAAARTADAATSPDADTLLVRPAETPRPADSGIRSLTLLGVASGPVWGAE